jgi:hypothetical protein
MDLVRNRVVMFPGRLISNENPLFEGLGIGRTMYFYDIANNQWDVDPPQLVPDFVPTMETYAIYQEENTQAGFLLGGQHVRGGWCSDLIYRITFAQNPADKSIHWERWSRFPVEELHGPGVVGIDDDDDGQDDRVIIVGGGNRVGPFFKTNRVWSWDMSKDASSLSAVELERKRSPDQKKPKLTVVAATLGRFDVTDTMQELIDEGWDAFPVYLPFPAMWKLSEVASRRWMKVKVYKHSLQREYVAFHPNSLLEGKNGGHYMTLNPTDRTLQLSVSLLEPSGRIRTVKCPGCRFSWWDEAAEDEYYANGEGQANYTVNFTYSVVY